MQNQRPLAFFSQALPPSHRHKAVHEWELMAIVFAIQKWRPYLLGCKFVVRTDQKSLKFLLERVIAGDYQKWIAKLLGYDFYIEYKRGLENTAANVLSRLPEAMALHLLNVVTGMNTAIFEEQVSLDPFLSSVCNDLLTGSVAHTGYTVRNGSLLFKERLALPPTSPMIPLLLSKFHNSPVGGHHGVLKTYQRMARELYWPGMKARIRSFVAECAV